MKNKILLMVIPLLIFTSCSRQQIGLQEDLYVEQNSTAHGENTYPNSDSNELENEVVSSPSTEPIDEAKIFSSHYTIPVLVISYFPVKGDMIDIDLTGDYGEPYEDTKQKTEALTLELKEALEKGSQYHGFENSSAIPSLKYEILGEYEFKEALPVIQNGTSVPQTDYAAIMEKVDIRTWVEEKGVKEVWIWGYHGGVLNLWESNMSGPYGDISNSNRDPNDLPIFNKTYTVYHYNYQRGLSEAYEDHMHQIEAVLNYIDGRDKTPPSEWDKLLFWGKFVGSDESKKIIRPGCGWSHYPPNAVSDYDWYNNRVVESDIGDWKPDGSGRKQEVNADLWSGDSLKWFIYWCQNIPGYDNGLIDQNRTLTNWWLFIGDFDYAIKNSIKLTYPD